MFTGIVETLGTVFSLKKENSNLHLTISSSISAELKIDQSVTHNGVCLTVVGVDPAAKTHTVTAIQETLAKTNLGFLKPGDVVNLERCVKVGDRLDGHIVQGHVDTTAACKNVEDQHGSWHFTFEYARDPKNITVEKGSVCVNGISLTVVNSWENTFSVAIIPYTFEHTNFKNLKVGDVVNIEFDILGKYIAKMMEGRG